jgi:hypothetical protein
MLRNFKNKLALNLLRINLSPKDLIEMYGWQRNSYLAPFPFFIKKAVLNSINSINSHWFEICTEKSALRNYLSKISEQVYFMKNNENSHEIIKNSNKENIKAINNLQEIENKISELSKKGKNIFLLFHSNSSPKIRNFNYHRSFSSQIENKSNNNVFEEEFESIIKKIIKIKNITFVIDDFDKLDLNKSMYLIDNKEFKITCNYLIIKT